jgi:hypothetical protein
MVPGRNPDPSGLHAQPAHKASFPDWERCKLYRNCWFFFPPFLALPARDRMAPPPPRSTQHPMVLGNLLPRLSLPPGRERGCSGCILVENGRYSNIQGGICQTTLLSSVSEAARRRANNNAWKITLFSKSDILEYNCNIKTRDGVPPNLGAWTLQLRSPRNGGRDPKTGTRPFTAAADMRRNG